MAEVYSQPRVPKEALRQGLSVGGAYDLLTGYNLRDTRDYHRMWQELQEDDPELTVCSPPCTAFTPLQSWNFPRMEYDKVVALVGDGLHHVATSCEVADWQDDRGKLFLLEQPKPSKAWEEPRMVALRERPGIHLCGRPVRIRHVRKGLAQQEDHTVGDQLKAYSLRVDEEMPRRSPTRSPDRRIREEGRGIPATALQSHCQRAQTTHAKQTTTASTGERACANDCIPSRRSIRRGM